MNNQHQPQANQPSEVEPLGSLSVSPGSAVCPKCNGDGVWLSLGKFRPESETWVDCGCGVRKGCNVNFNRQITKLSPERCPIACQAIRAIGGRLWIDSNIVYNGLRWEITVGGEIWHIGSHEPYENAWTDKDFGLSAVVPTPDASPRIIRRHSGKSSYHDGLEWVVVGGLDAGAGIWLRPGEAIAVINDTSTP